MSNRLSLYILLGSALLAWAALLLFTRFIPPATVPTFFAFFILLMIALTSTFTPLAYVIGVRLLSARLYRATLRHALRQGLLLALCIVLNLVLRVLHSWNLIMAIVIFAAVVVVELLSLARK